MLPSMWGEDQRPAGSREVDLREAMITARQYLCGYHHSGDAANTSEEYRPRFRTISADGGGSGKARTQLSFTACGHGGGNFESVSFARYRCLVDAIPTGSYEPDVWDFADHRRSCIRRIPRQQIYADVYWSKPERGRQFGHRPHDQRLHIQA